MSLTTTTEALFQYAKSQLQQDLKRLANQIEALTVLEADGLWPDDSGSARASITAYSLGAESHDKNFAEWEYARQQGYVSPKWRNTADNFQPEVNEVDVDGSIGILDTIFVQYAEKIGGAEALKGALDASAPGFANVVAGLLSKTFR